MGRGWLRLVMALAGVSVFAVDAHCVGRLGP
jgi:hypothetical protein